MPEDSSSTEKDDNLIDMDSFHITFKSSYVIVMLGSISDLKVNYYWCHWWFYLVKIWMIFYCRQSYSINIWFKTIMFYINQSTNFHDI